MSCRNACYKIIGSDIIQYILWVRSNDIHGYITKR